MKAWDANSLASRRRAEQLAARERLQPAEQFVWRVIRGLPWSLSDDVLYADQRIVSAAGSGMAIDHDALRRRDHAAQGLCWRRCSELVAIGILESYCRGELTPGDAEREMFRCAIACNGADVAALLTPRIHLIEAQSLAAALAPAPAFEETWATSWREIIARLMLETMARSVRQPQASQRARRSQWMPRVAVTVVNVLLAENPHLPIALTAYRPTNALFTAASDWLVTLGTCDHDAPPQQRTLYQWYLAQGTRPRRRPGRPRRQ